MEARILGISLGTKYMGIALWENGELMDWRVKTFTGRWSKGKLRYILLTLSGIIDEERIHTVAVKIPDIIPASKGFTQLMGSLNVLCEQKHFKASYYTLSDIKEHVAPDGDINKAMLAALVARKYPELSHYCKKQKNGNKYYDKVFEAVAAIDCARSASLLID